MVYVFGGGCGGMYRQGRTTGDVLDDQFLGQGYRDDIELAQRVRE